jgi:hypothetical protein
MISGFAVIKSQEYWNNGMLEYWVWRNEICFNLAGPHRKLKSAHHPLFIPNIPFSHHSLIPLVNPTPSGAKSKPGPLVKIPY